MAYNFYMIEGKKLIDYKPTIDHYRNALLKKAGEMLDNPNYMEENKDKILFLLIKIIGKERRRMEEQKEEIICGMFNLIQLVKKLVSEYTPRQFMNLFPIKKDYDGDKYGVKDYFYCMDYISKIGIDNHIGEKASEFLMEYWNMDINFYIAKWMDIVSAVDIIQTGRDHMLDFFEENGLHFHKFHQEGNEMVDDETGERFQIAKTKKRLKKLFTVV